MVSPMRRIRCWFPAARAVEWTGMRIWSARRLWRYYLLYFQEEITLAEDREQEHKFEVKDKRRVTPDGVIKDENQAAEPEVEQAAEALEQETVQKPAAGEQESEQEAAEEAEEEASDEVEMPAPNIYFELQLMALGLSQMAWQFLGSRLLPGHKEPIRDLQQAKMAIDTVAVIADKLHSQLGGDDRRALRSLVSDLQINFVKHSS
jgi:hypothetical protein